MILLKIPPLSQYPLFKYQDQVLTQKLKAASYPHADYIDSEYYETHTQLTDYYTPQEITAEVKKIQLEFAYYLADVIKEQAQRAIRTQQFRMHYAPLSPRTKMQKMHPDKFWYETGFLLNHITVWKQNDDVYVGIHPYVRYPGTNTKVVDVVKRLEFGTRYIPARPLFIPIANSVLYNYVKQFKDFIAYQYPDLLPYIFT